MKLYHKEVHKCFAIQKICVFLHSQNRSIYISCPVGGIGRRAGLKNQWINFLAGSIPAPGTVEPPIIVFDNQGVSFITQ